MAKPATRAEPNPEPPIEAMREDVLLWDVVNATYVTEALTPTGRAEALTLGTHQDVGARFLIDGKGLPAPPLALTVTHDAADWQAVAVSLTGGSPAQNSVSIFWGDSTGEYRDGTAGTASHRYAQAGEYIVNVVNDYGQDDFAVVRVAPPEPPTPPEEKPPELNNSLPVPEARA